MPANSARAEGASSAPPPYAASTCIQRLRSSQTRAMPGEIVDQSGVRAARVRDDRAHRLGIVAVGERGRERVAGEAVVDERHEERIDVEQVHRVAHRRVRVVGDREPQPCAIVAERAGGRCRGRPPARRGSRRNRPARTFRPRTAGMPARSAMNRSASFSAHTAPADSIHETPLIDASETTASNSIDAFVGADGIQARKRGLSARMTAGASTEVKSSSTSSGSLPDALIIGRASAGTSEGWIVPLSGVGSSAASSRSSSRTVSASACVAASNSCIERRLPPRTGSLPEELHAHLVDGAAQHARRLRPGYSRAAARAPSSRARRCPCRPNRNTAPPAPAR